MVHAWTLYEPDGTQMTAQTPANTYNTTVTQAGAYSEQVHVYCTIGGPSYDYGTDTGTFTVGPGVGGSIAVSPDPPVVNQPASLSAAATGGNPGYTFAWDLNNDGNFSDATTRTVDTTFTTTGPHIVKVQITDNFPHNFTNTHTTTVTRTLNVVTPAAPPPAGTPTPAPPPPCIKVVTFQLSEFKTDGCFTQTAQKSSDGATPDRWVTTSAITFNGVPVPDYGQTFTIAGPSNSDPGGHFTAANSTLQVGGFTAFSGNIDWSLPKGGIGDTGTVSSFSVTPGATLFGLNVGASTALTLGRDADAKGTYYAKFALSIELPAQFTAGPDPQFGGVTGAASLRVDDAGVQTDGLKVEVKNVWLNKLKVDSVCFSYLASASSATAACAPPSFGDNSEAFKAPGADAPFIQCTTPTGPRWDGNAVVELPSGLQLGAFGGVAGGQISTLGGSISGLGTKVPIADGLYLDSVSFGLCLSPPPFKIKGQIGANFMGSSRLVKINGSLEYTDATQTSPWRLDLAGDVSVGGVPVGSGTLSVNESKFITFSLAAGFSFENTVSLNGQIAGWIDAQRGDFVVSGSAKACLPNCLEGDGEISSKGVAGCITFTSSSSGIDIIWPLDGSAPHFDHTTYAITAGFGYVWGASWPDLFGNSCDFSAYEPAPPTYARVARTGARLRMRIARGTQAVSLRIPGSHGVPKIILHGPHGVTITSPAHARSSFDRGHYLLSENTPQGTTNLLLLHPAAGTWTVRRVPGTASSPTKLDRSTFEAPATFGAHVSGKGAVRTLRVAYAVPVGAAVQLVERGKRVGRPIVARLSGGRCHGLPARRPGSDEKILCATIRFRPAAGPGGTREVQAVVTRRGMPLALKTIASFRAPRQRLPTRVGALRVRRGSGSLVVAFTPSHGGSRYSVAAKLSDGRKLAFDLGGGCRALRIPGVPAGVAATAKIAGRRYDQAMGRSRTITIKANALSAGHFSKKLRLGKVCS